MIKKIIETAAGWFRKPVSAAEHLKELEKWAAASQLKRIEEDTMPEDTATEALASRGRQTSKERKQYRSARVKRFCSTQSPKALDRQIAAKLADKTILQLARWNKRAIKNRFKLQRQYERLVKKPDSPAKRRGMEMADFLVNRLDILRDAYSQSIAWRLAVAEGRPMKPELVGVLRAPLTGRLYIWTESLPTGGVTPKRTEFPRWVRTKLKGGKNAESNLKKEKI